MNRQIIDIKGQGTRSPAAGWMIAAALLVLSLLILLHSWSQSKNGVSPIEILLGTPSGSSRDVIVVSRDGVTVYMPANATELDGTLSIAVAAPSLMLVADDTEWNILKVVKVEFRNPDGMSLPNVFFSEPLEICFHFTEEQWQAFAGSPDSYRVQHYADRIDPPGWEILPQVTYPDRLMLCGQAKELSLFRLAIRAEAGIPVTGWTTTLAPAAVIPPVQSREIRERDASDNAATLEVVPTNPPPTNVPPAIQPQPTNPPPAAPHLNEPPAPADPPVKEEEKQKKEEEKQEEQEKKEEEKQKKEEEKQEEQEKKEEEKQKKEEEKQKDKKE